MGKPPIMHRGNSLMNVSFISCAPASFLLFYTVFCKQEPTVTQLEVQSESRCEHMKSVGFESEAASVQESEVRNHSPALNQDAGRQTAPD